MPEPIYFLSSDLYQQLLRLLKKMDNVRGPGVVNTRDGITINPPSKPVPPARASVQKDEMVTGFISGDADGDGKYWGKIYYNPPSSVDPTTDLSASDLGSIPDAADCIVLNVTEGLGFSETGHDLTASPNDVNFSPAFIGRVVGTNPDGKKIVHIQSVWVACTATS